MVDNAPDHPLDARSRYLGRIAVGDPRRALRLAARWLTLLGTATIVGVLIWATLAERFDPDGPARLLYRLHDDAWLPLWGTLWTAFHPYGWIWFGAGGVLAALWLAGLLAGRPMLEPVQRWLTGAAATSPAGQRFLIAWHRRTKGGVLPARHLELVVARRHRRALDAVTEAAVETAQAAATADIVHLSRLARLRAVLLCHKPAPAAARLAALDILATARLCIAMASDDTDRPPAVRRSLRGVDDAILAVAATWPVARPGTAPQPRAPAAPFAVFALVDEACRLTAPEPEPTQDGTETGDAIAAGDATAPGDTIAAGDAIAAACRRIDAMDQLSDVLLTAAFRSRATRRPAPGVVDGMAEGLAPGGAGLGVSLALSVAYATRSPALARQYLESAEALAFAADAAADATDPKLADSLDLAQTLTDGLPSSDQRALAWAIARRFAGSPGVELTGDDDGLFGSNDRRHVAATPAALAEAAGFDAAAPG